MSRVLGAGLLVIVALLLAGHLASEFWRRYYQTDWAAARIQMTNFGQAINNYRMINEALPLSLEDLLETDDRNPHPYIDSIPTDPWGSDYDYEVLDAEHYVIRSRGEDGEADTSDDIVYPGMDR